MKRIGSIENQSGERMALYEAMADDENIQKAYNKARKCKRYRKEVLIFTKDKEENLERVRNDILRLTYEPSMSRASTDILKFMNRKKGRSWRCRSTTG